MTNIGSHKNAGSYDMPIKQRRIEVYNNLIEQPKLDNKGNKPKMPKSPILLYQEKEDGLITYEHWSGDYLDEEQTKSEYHYDDDNKIAMSIERRYAPFSNALCRENIKYYDVDGEIVAGDTQEFENGVLSVESSFDVSPFGVMSNRHKLYHNNGNLASVDVTQTSKDHSLQHTKTLHFYADGMPRASTERIFASPHSLTCDIQNYDTNGNLKTIVSVERHPISGELLERTVTNAAGEVIEHKKKN